MNRFLARSQRFDVVGSTNDVVREWLADGIPEVCLAIADAQTAGRGRADRSWVAPPGSALLLSLGFRPTWLPPDQAWRVAAVASLAMADAAESIAALPEGSIRLKWPNDLVAEASAVGVRKLAGVLGETDGLGTKHPRVVIGLGINADWRAADFPPDLARSMTSLRELAFGRPVDRIALAATFVDRLQGSVQALRGGRFAAETWQERQLTTGRTIRIEGSSAIGSTVRALGVDPISGALIVEDPDAVGGTRHVMVGEVTHVRLAEPVGGGV